MGEQLWDYDRMGQECAKYATKRSRMTPRPTMDDIVKYAYETTMFAMRDEYEAKIAVLEAQLERATSGTDRWLPDHLLERSDDE